MNTYKETAQHDWSKDSIRLIVTPSITAKSTYFYVQEAGHFSTLSHYYTERVHLNSYLIVFTLSGKGYLKYRDKCYRLLPGDAFFINCMEYQFYETDKDDLWEILWIHFNGSTSHGYYEQFSQSGTPIVSFGLSSPVASILEELIKIHQQKDIRTEPLASKLIVDLLTEFLLSAKFQYSQGNFLADYIKAVIADMEKRFNEKITLDELAHKHAVSKFHLSKEFKRYTGFTLNEYLINIRISFAKELLKYSNLPVAEIALRSGIENVSHFINLFKDREDKTPLVFRKEWQHSK